MAIGTLAGLFSGLFGVGGGSVIVPLLVLWLDYDERSATATSLAAVQLTQRALASTGLADFSVKDTVTEHHEVEPGHDRGGAEIDDLSGDAEH
jgi:uncharacterized membrane protein YfcA